MAISFVNAGAEGSAGSGDITLGAPASPANDDIWIAVVHSSDQVSHSFTDWTQIVQGNGGGTTSRISVWYFRYAGSTPNLTVTHTSGQSPIGGIAAFRGCKKTGSPVDTAGSISGGTDGSIEHAAINPTQADCALLVCNGSADDNNRTALGGDYVVDFEDSAGGTQNCFQTTAGTPDGSVSLFHDISIPDADTGTVTVTQAASDAWASVLIALAPDLDQSLTLTAPVVTFSAPTSTLVAEATLVATAPTINFSAPAVTLVEGAPEQTLVCTAPVLTLSAPTMTMLAEIALVLGAPVITFSAPTALAVPGGVTLSLGAPTITISAPSALLVEDGGPASQSDKGYHFGFKMFFRF